MLSLFSHAIFRRGDLGACTRSVRGRGKVAFFPSPLRAARSLRATRAYCKKTFSLPLSSACQSATWAKPGLDFIILLRNSRNTSLK